MPGGGGGPELLIVETSLDGTSWTTIDTFGDREPYTWEGVWIGQSARFVRLTATNPSLGASGSLSEVEIWGEVIPISLEQDLAVVPDRAAIWRGSVARTGRGRGRIKLTDLRA